MAFTLSNRQEQIYDHLRGCYCKGNETCINNIQVWLPLIIPSVPDWLSHQTQSICQEEETGSCVQCVETSDDMIMKMKDDSKILFHQKEYLLDILCGIENECQQIVETDWQGIEICLTQDWILSNLSCIYFGSCQLNEEMSCSQVIKAGIDPIFKYFQIFFLDFGALYHFISNNNF